MYTIFQYVVATTKLLGPIGFIQFHIKSVGPVRAGPQVKPQMASPEASVGNFIILFYGNKVTQSKLHTAVYIIMQTYCI